MSSNKGFYEGYVLWLIIGVVIIIFITLWIGNFAKVGEEIAEDSCYREVRAHAMQMNMIGGKRLATELNCPTNYKQERVTDEKLKELLAKELVDCWETWGKGELKLFPEEEGVFCHVCTVFEFKNQINLRGQDFQKFMLEEGYVEQIIPYSTDIITGIKQDIENSNPNEFIDINTGQDYAIVFKHIKGKDKIIGDLQRETVKKAGAIIYGVGAAVATGIIGAKIGATIGGTLCSPVPGGTAVCGFIGGVVGFVGGAAGQAVVSFILWITANEPLQTFTYVALAPYTEEGMIELGCEYAPAKQ